MSASMQGAMAFQKGLGCVHSLSHSLGGVDPRLHHGTLNAMFLPAVVSVQRGGRIGAERPAPGAHGPRHGPGVGQRHPRRHPRHECPPGPAHRAGRHGRGADWFDRIITGALADHCHKTNPRIASADEYRAMLSDSL
jgi:4-hydroxybutyrate dehydrogenase